MIYVAESRTEVVLVRAPDREAAQRWLQGTHGSTDTRLRIASPDELQQMVQSGHMVRSAYRR